MSEAIVLYREDCQHVVYCVELLSKIPYLSLTKFDYSKVYLCRNAAQRVETIKSFLDFEFTRQEDGYLIDGISAKEIVKIFCNTQSCREVEKKLEKYRIRPDGKGLARMVSIVYNAAKLDPEISGNASDTEAQGEPCQDDTENSSDSEAQEDSYQGDATSSVSSNSIPSYVEELPNGPEDKHRDLLLIVEEKQEKLLKRYAEAFAGTADFKKYYDKGKLRFIAPGIIQNIHRKVEGRCMACGKDHTKDTKYNDSAKYSSNQGYIITVRTKEGDVAIVGYCKLQKVKVGTTLMILKRADKK